MLNKRKGICKIIPKKQLKRIKENKCPVCGLPKKKWKRRKDWRCCSKECTGEFWKTYISYNWADIREKALERDNYTCVKCGDNRRTIKIKVKRKRLINVEEYAKKLLYEEYEIEETFNNLIGDHIKPIALGGKEFDLNNIQTLCYKCNKKKTIKDIKKINIMRKNQNQTFLNQTFKNKK